MVSWRQYSTGFALLRGKIVNTEQELAAAKEDLAAAKDAKNGEQERLLFQLLLSLNNQLGDLNKQLGGLNNQLGGLQEEKIILMHEQAPSKHCLQLVHAVLPVFTSC